MSTLDYETPRSRPPANTLKWMIFVGAILASFMSGDKGSSIGGAACGLWIAFALIHIQDMKSGR